MLLAKSLLALVIAPIILTLTHCASSERTVYVQDKYGNVVFKDGTVRYVHPVPVGNATYTTKLDYDAKGLEILYGSARTFVQDVQPNSFPFDLLEKAANGDFEFGKDSEQLVSHFYGLTACVVVGLAAVVTFVISGLCFCCCRGCCGNCGGDGKQVFSEHEGRKRMGLTQALFLMSLCVLSAAICTNVTSERFADAIEFTNETVATNIEDIDRFLKNTGAKFRYTVTDMYEIVHEALIKDIDDIGNFTALVIRDDLNIGPMLQDLHELDNRVANVSFALNQTRVDIAQLQATEARLISRLGSLADDIDTTQAQCAGRCSPNQCSNIASDTVRQGSSNSSGNLPDLSDTQTKVDAISSTAFRDVANQTNMNLAQLGEQIDEFSGSIQEGVRTALEEYRSLINSLSEGVFKTMSETLPAEKMKTQTNDVFDAVKEYDIYRQWFGFALTLVFIIIIVLILVALVLGMKWDDVTALPHERTSISNIGGNLLLFSVAVLFLTGALLTLLATLTFLFGALLDKTCEPFRDLTMFRDFLDTDKVSGFSFAEEVLGNDTLNVRTYDVLLSCRADQTPWVAFRLGDIVPLEDYLDYTKYLGDLGQILQGLTDFSFSGYKVFSTQMADALDTLDDTGLGSMDLQAINATVGLPAIQFNIDDVIATMQNISSQCSDSVKERWNNHTMKLQSIRDTQVAEFNRQKIQLGISASVLQDNIVQIQTSVGLLGKMLPMVHSYATEVLYMISHDLGNCLPLWNLYKSVEMVLCDYGVDTLNGYWFSVGWGILFFFPMIIVGAKLSKHYKIMDKAVGYERYIESSSHPQNSSGLADVTDGHEDCKL